MNIQLLQFTKLDFNLLSVCSYLSWWFWCFVLFCFYQSLWNVWLLWILGFKRNHWVILVSIKTKHCIHPQKCGNSSIFSIFPAWWLLWFQKKFSGLATAVRMVPLGRVKTHKLPLVILRAVAAPFQKEGEANWGFSRITLF